MLLHFDEYTQTRHEWHDTEPGKAVVNSIQDVEPYIEHNKRLAGKLNKKETWWYIGTIPNVLLVRWARESGLKMYTKEWQKYVIKQLNKPEYKQFNVNRIKL